MHACDFKDMNPASVHGVSSEGAATRLRKEAALIVQRTAADRAHPALWQCLRRLTEFFQAYNDGAGPPRPRCKCVLVQATVAMQTV